MPLILVGDFETTVTGDREQEYTEVWSSALVSIGSENVIIHHSIEEAFMYLRNINDDIVLYYHNLKFDGQFWIDYLIRSTEYEQAYYEHSETEYTWIETKYMLSKTFKYLVSDIGQWYTITIKTDKGRIIEIRDSFKLLPFSVKRIGQSFKTKHKKLDMEYIGDRYAGCEITDEEKAYIRNDVLVVKEALEIMFQEGHKKLTIGSCCLSEFKHGFDRFDYLSLFPDLYSVPFYDYKFLSDSQHDYGTNSIGDYIRKSYKGGWCYLVPEKKEKRWYDGTTADVNSLYPSMMHSESGNYYPYGYPTFWTGEIPDDVMNQRIGVNNEKCYWFVRLRTKFKLKAGKLPTVQIKRNPLYKGNEWLKTSDAYDSRTGKWHKTFLDIDGKMKECKPELTLTMTDYFLLIEHYDLYDTEYLDGCWFHCMIGLFDNYINKYKEQKQNSTGARREEAKLFLNNLYGKMASSPVSNFKVAYMDENIIKYKPVKADDKIPGYIPIGTAITSYARNFTIRAAQKNFHGVNKRGFIYADTDSIHCDLPASDIVGINVHPTDFCCWKLESYWDVGFFTRQKTYIEHVTHEDGEPIEPYYNVKAAGMSQKSKDLFIKSLIRYEVPEEEKENYTEQELIFIEQHLQLEDFTRGLIIPSGRLRPKRVIGGIVLIDGEHEMR